MRTEYWPEKGLMREDLRGKLKNIDLIVPDVETRDTAYFNQRFGWVRRYSSVLRLVAQIDEEVIDLKTGEVPARYIDFETAIPNRIGAQKSLRDFKGWLAWGMGSCERTGHKVNRKKFNEFKRPL
ncbi:MAG: hypothetical protein DRQ61_05745 [Gammaproteobacteria bacterium]|nr:MAG: hypothetical protein DRQ61_05745 [Gammaproteobacteria bacterium]